MWRIQLCLLASLCLSSGSFGIAVAKSQPESSADSESDSEGHIADTVPPRRIADLLYHAAVSADNDVYGEYGAIISPEPAIAVVDSPVIATQYHAQDELGQYSYGYSNPTSTKSESRTLDGIVEGTYSYISPDGRIITNNYAADHTGFRSSLAPSNGEDHLYAVAPAIAGPPPPVDIATTVVAAVDAYEPEPALVSHAAVPVTHTVEHVVEPVAYGVSEVKHHVEHAHAVPEPVYVEEPAVIARTAPVAAVTYTPEAVAAVAHRAETAYVQDHIREPAYVQETVHHVEPAYVQQRTYVEPVAVAKPVYQVAEPVAAVQQVARVQPVHHTVANTNTYHVAEPVVHHTTAPVVHHAKPVVHHAEPVVHHAEPVVHAKPAVTVARAYPYAANIKSATVHRAPARKVYHQEAKPVVVSSLGSRSYARPSHARTYSTSYSKPYGGYSSYRRPSSYTYSRGGSYAGRRSYNSGYRGYRSGGYSRRHY